MAIFADWANAITDDSGLAIGAVQISVRNPINNALITIFSDAAGTVRANPFTTDATGVVRFFVDISVNSHIRVEAVKTGFDFTVWNSLFNNVRLAHGVPRGADRTVQYRRGEAFAGDADFTWDETTKRMAVAGIQGGLNIVPLATPAAPTVTVIGTAGTTRYDYRITARSHTGETLASATTSITTGNATLSATNFNRISWSTVSGAHNYRVWRVHSAGTPTTLGVIATVVGTTVDDTGLAGGGEAIPADDSSGNIGIGGIATPPFSLTLRAPATPSDGVGWTFGTALNSRNWLIVPDWATFGDLVIITSSTRTIGQADVVRLVLGPGGHVGLGGILTPTHPIHHGNGAHLTAAGVWTNVSSRQLKTNFEAVSVLDKLANLPIQKYDYKKFETEKDAEGKEKLDKNDQPIRKWKNKAVHVDKHISPVAEDMHTIFGVGSKDGLAAIDVAGVALQGVKELLARMIELEKRIK